MLRFLSLGLVVWLGACATTEYTSTEYTSTSDGSGELPYTGDIRVLDSMPPSNTYERLGIVIVRGASITSDATLRRNLLAQARKKGANAVVLQGPVQTSPRADGQAEKRLAAWAIRLKP